jgi:hypothetical protein
VPHGQRGGSIWPYSWFLDQEKNILEKNIFFFMILRKYTSVCLKFKNMYKYCSLHFRIELFIITRPKEVLCNIYIFVLALISLKLQVISVTGFNSSLVFDDVV